jgi:hypothetical protein
MKQGVVAVAIVAVLCGRVHAQDMSPIIHEGIVEASVDQVWTAFTTSDGLRSWLAPHAEIDLRVGGLMRTNYSPQGQLGDSQTIENTVLSFEPRRMISIKVAKRPTTFRFRMPSIRCGPSAISRRRGRTGRPFAK